MNDIRLLGVYINERVQKSQEVQNILTRYGCSIKTRLGLHEVVDNYCSTSGLIVLELTGVCEEMDKLEQDLKAIPALQVQRMDFQK